MNCPGHMLLFGTQLRSYRDLPLRYAEAAPLHRDELAGSAPRADARPPRHPGRRAHLLHARSRSRTRSSAASTYADFLYDLFGARAARFELSTRPDNKLGTDEEWDFTEGALQAALERRGIDYALNEGDGAFYGPKIDLHMTDVLGRSWQMGTIQLDAPACRSGSASPTWGPTTASTRRTSSTGRCSARSSASSASCIEHYGGAFPFWLAPVQVRVLPVGEAHLEAATRSLERLRAPATGSRSASPPETIGKRIRARRAREDPLHDRLRRPRERGEPRDPRARRRARASESLADFLAKLATLDS